MRARLKKDIVIKAGTVFEAAPVMTTRDDSHVEHVIGLGKDTAGSLIFSVDKFSDPKIGQWFEIL